MKRLSKNFQIQKKEIERKFEHDTFLDKHKIKAFEKKYSSFVDNSSNRFGMQQDLTVEPPEPQIIDMNHMLNTDEGDAVYQPRVNDVPLS